MIWWLLLWTGRIVADDGGEEPEPDETTLPVIKRDGDELGPLPVFRRRQE